MNIIERLRVMGIEREEALAVIAARKRATVAEFDAKMAPLYYEARESGLWEEALRLGPLPRSTAYRLTRNLNEAKGRHIRWTVAR